MGYEYFSLINWYALPWRETTVNFMSKVWGMEQC